MTARSYLPIQAETIFANIKPAYIIRIVFFLHVDPGLDSPRLRPSSLDSGMMDQDGQLGMTKLGSCGYTKPV